MISRSRGIRYGILCLLLLVGITCYAGVPDLDRIRDVTGLSQVQRHGHDATPTNAQSNSSRVLDVNDLLNLPKPSHRIAAFVFAGRREFVPILNCYLERNLVRNGGWLDEVVWSIKTTDQDDRDYIKQLISDTPEYSGIEPPASSGKEQWIAPYTFLQNDTIYIKIDDDIVFFEDHTIPALVTRLLDNATRYSAVSANVINQPAFSWVHHHLDVTRPFRAEIAKPDPYVDFDTPSQLPLTQRLDWRPSKLPQWTGSPGYDIRFDPHAPAPFKHHRWLPLPSDYDIELTPMGALSSPNGAQYTSHGAGWKVWAIAAQEHMSFLTHLEYNELHRYKFDLWNFHYERLSINFLAFRGSLVLEHPIEGLDEEFLTMVLPKRLRRPVVVEGNGLAVHFSFGRQFDRYGGWFLGGQGRALNDTDIVFRYRSYAEEFICGRRIGSRRL